MDDTLRQELNSFKTADEFFMWSDEYPNCAISAGVKHLALKAGAFWLLDVISAAQANLKHYSFQKWRLKTVGTDATLSCVNGGSKIVYARKLSDVVFPLPEIKLYATVTDQRVHIMLWNEF